MSGTNAISCDHLRMKIFLVRSTKKLPAVGVSYGDFQQLTEPGGTSKSLETLFILKRLASAVQLRPWPPYFQSLARLAFRSLAAIGCNSFLTSVDTRAQTTQFVDHSLLAFRHELLIDVQCGRCPRMAHLPLCITIEAPKRLAPGAVFLQSAAARLTFRSDRFIAALVNQR